MKLFVLTTVVVGFFAFNVSSGFAQSELACGVPCTAAQPPLSNNVVSSGDQGPCPDGEVVVSMDSHYIGDWALVHVVICSGGSSISVEEDIWDWQNSTNQSYDPELSNSDNGSDNQNSANDAVTYETYYDGEYVDQKDPGC